VRPNRTLYIFFMCLMFFPVPIEAKSSSALVDKGNAAYAKQQYDEALKEYEAAGVDSPESPQIYFNKGAAYYRKGEFDKAKEAWEKAALNTKDVSFEARSLFNLGNTAFQESQRQQDSDPKKALEFCTQSVGYYQQVIDFSKNPENGIDPSLLKDASENLELVRLIMKSMIDAMSKQQEQAQQQQQAADELKELIKKQKELIDRNQYYHQEQQDKGDTRQLSENISQMAGDQDRLKEDTKNTAEKLPSADPSKPNPAGQAKEHLIKAQSSQQAATDNMTAGRLADATPNQESSLKELKDALESLEKDGSNGNKQEKQDQQSQQQNEQKQGDQQQKKQASDGQQNQQQKQQEQQQQGKQQEKNQDSEKWIAGKPNDAQKILDEEKENQKNRLPESPGGYRDVDKDW
jgi:Ca-activated chloride channel homolog